MVDFSGSLLSQFIKQIEEEIALGKEIENPIRYLAEAIKLQDYYEKYLGGQCPDISEELRAQVSTVIKLLGLRKEKDIAKISLVVDSVLASNFKAVADYKSGKMKDVGFFVGKVLKEFKNVDVEELKNIILEKIRYV